MRCGGDLNSDPLGVKGQVFSPAHYVTSGWALVEDVGVIPMSGAIVNTNCQEQESVIVYFFNSFLFNWF